MSSQWKKGQGPFPVTGGFRAFGGYKRLERISQMN